METKIECTAPSVRLGEKKLSLHHCRSDGFDRRKMESRDFVPP